jgi:ribosome-binding ATPase YchF (GTP1/OBG family)
MDNSQLTISLVSNQSVQGAQGHHQHPRKSIADMIKDMESAIDDATKSGKLTGDQASAMTKVLDDIKKMLSQAQSTGPAQTGGATQLSADDREKIRKQLHDIGKQLFQAFNSQSADSSTRQSGAVDAIFKAMDANKDGSVNKNELTSFLSGLTANASNSSHSNGVVASSFTYSAQATMSITRTQSSFSTIV